MRPVSSKRNNGQIVATDELRTGGKPARIVLTADLSRLTPHWDDLCYVRATVTDRYGVPIPDYDGLISFKIAGPGLIAAVDNGDNSSPEPFQGSERHAFQGRSVALVRARASPGRITVSASAVGLAGASVIIANVANTSQSSSRSARIPTLFVIGDSTVRNGRGDGANGQWGWGDEIAPFFDLTKINIINSALGGRSSRTYMTEGHWARVLSQLKPCDFVIMQFGHNDGGEINDTSRARGSLRGAGPETQEIDNLLTKQHEVVHSFGWYLRKYIADIKAKKATAIVCSLIPRKIWKDTKIVRSHDT